MFYSFFIHNLKLSKASAIQVNTAVSFDLKWEILQQYWKVFSTGKLKTMKKVSTLKKKNETWILRIIVNDLDCAKSVDYKTFSMDQTTCEYYLPEEEKNWVGI